ncbi:hypothetical protein HK103_004122 [Boothiomyces macroporosus]|uniref:Mitochondrial carrier protein n=1 Tax=Boothiomyces macroporosus TaxID=261099 RepID=A0AAD5UHV1_9FUNG|nr:hypothetical protein HK103_004122 [Boothiomyces macroporosus]
MQYEAQQNINILRSKATFEGMIHIAQTEGILKLWRGLGPSLLFSIPSIILYYVGYEELRNMFNSNNVAYAPLLSGAIARTFAVTITSPIELIRTKTQAGTKSATNVFIDVIKQSKTEGSRVFFRGLGPTLLRDAPFSGIYWMSLETIKDNIGDRYPNKTYLQELSFSFINGSISGIIAAFFTHPFDVVKTYQQVSAGSSRMTGILQNVYATNGLGGFFTGLTPRLARVSPACGIMISAYEIGKRILKEC